MLFTVCWAVKARFSIVGAAPARPPMAKSPVVMADKCMLVGGEGEDDDDESGRNRELIVGVGGNIR